MVSQVSSVEMGNLLIIIIIISSSSSTKQWRRGKARNRGLLENCSSKMQIFGIHIFFVENFYLFVGKLHFLAPPNFYDARRRRWQQHAAVCATERTESHTVYNCVQLL